MARTPLNLPTEEQEQIKLASWMTIKGIKFYSIPNGGRRSPTEGLRFKRSGVQSGIPDLCVPIPRGAYHGLYIELKRQMGGRLSDNQIHWLEFLRSQGYYAEVAEGFDAAKEIITHYLSLAAS